MPILSESTGVGTLPFVDLRLRDETFTNPRTSSGLDGDSIRELAIHIGLHGVIVPLIVTRKEGLLNTPYLIIAGQRRYRAIEWLIHWFTPSTIHTIREQCGPIADSIAELSHEDVSAIEHRTKRLIDAVPVRYVSGDGLEGIALADNILRADLSAYEVAARLAQLSDAGATGRDLARLIGKSPGYVSKKLSAWRGAGPDLRTAWEKGLDEPTVFELAAFSHEKQAKTLSGAIGRRGAANRPGIDAIKDAKLVIARRSAPDTDDFDAGVLEALRWVTGEKVSETFARLVSDDEDR